MALPYDALTAALDAWLGQHIPSETRRARVGEIHAEEVRDLSFMLSLHRDVGKAYCSWSMGILSIFE